MSKDKLADVNLEKDLKLMQKAGYSITAGIAVWNKTDTTMTDPRCTRTSGQTKKAPRPIESGDVATMFFHKSWGYAGSVGTLSWQLDEKHRAVIMWRAPYNHVLYSNKLAVGIYTGTGGHERCWTSKMEDDDLIHELEYTHSVFNETEGTKELSKEKGGFKISGTMGTSHHAEVYVTVEQV